MKTNTETPTAQAQPDNSAEEMTRKQILAKYLDIDVEDLDGEDDDDRFELGSKEYLVLTDSEADKRAAEYIEDSLWAFNSSFLSDFTGLPEEMFKAVQDKCEGANDAILQCIKQVKDQSMVDGIDLFIEQAISADGRGHFMSSYDGEENEEGEYYIYRTN